MKAIRLLEQRWHLRPGATRNELMWAAKIFGVVFPDDYIEIMTWSDGGDFLLAEHYLRLWSICEVVDANAQLTVQSFLPGTVAIGNDGGDMLYLLDYRDSSTAPRLLEVEGGAMWSGECTVEGSSLTDALCAWSGLARVRAVLLHCLRARVEQMRLPLRPHDP